MFTGIIQYVGRVESAAGDSACRRLGIDVGPLAEGLGVGSSVAVDGACLTVSAIDGSRAEFDVVAETLTRTTLGGLAPGSEVNLELPIAAGAPLDGHIVTGHVDGVVEAARVDRSGDSLLLTLAAATELTDEMVEKGSIALAGVSLTLVGVEKGRFSVALVPTTLQRTTLGRLRVGERVNVELDIIGKYVRRRLENLAGGENHLTIEKLRRAGFA